MNYEYKHDTNFQDAFADVLEVEGDISDQPADRGGLTKWGITHSTYKHWLDKTEQKQRPVTEMTKDECREIYYTEYWVKGRCDLIADYNKALAEVHFDACVNHGIAEHKKKIGANYLLQRVLEVKPEHLDGVIGPKTLSLIAAFHSDKFLITRHLLARLGIYSAIVARDKSQLTFLRGWVERCRKVYGQFFG